MEEAESVVRVQSPLGLHARPWARVVGAAQGFCSQIVLTALGVEVDAKSTLQILASIPEVAQNEEVKIYARGRDAEEAVNAIQDIIEEARMALPDYRDARPLPYLDVFEAAKEFGSQILLEMHDVIIDAKSTAQSPNESKASAEKKILILARGADAGAAVARIGSVIK